MYKIVYADRFLYDNATADLEAEVNALIKEGWIPQGGVSITTNAENHQRYVLCQAMVKRE